MSEDVHICYCNGINKGEIVKAIKEKGLTTVDEVSDETSAGAICGGCVSDIEEILEEVNG